MTYDITSAAAFMAAHARILDRRRLALFQGTVGPEPVLAALGAYRNPDGGYGWGLEPDLRSSESQPGAALHAFEVFAEIAPERTPAASSLCDWLESVSLADGGLPFVLPMATTAGSAPWWTGADGTTSSLQITAIGAANALRVAQHDPAVASHPWLKRACEFCRSAIEAIEEPPFAYTLGFAVRFVETWHASAPAEAARLMDHLARFVPADGHVAVRGGAELEMLRPLDLAPQPDGIARAILSEEAILRDLDRVASQQQDDGGWVVDYRRVSPAGALEWRGYATVRAIRILAANDRR
jgi:hypothetical protein